MPEALIGVLKTGNGLMRLLRKAGAAAAAAELCRDIGEHYPEAAWAHRQLAFLLLHQADAEGAVTAFQVIFHHLLCYDAACSM